uniref:Uncharacterized protein n=1 Tax=Moniliophthora roreri TaxID=221103 RepID=A0A0W0FM75_MONRR
MSNQASSSFNLHNRPLPSPPTHFDDPEQVHYTGPFCPSPFELLYLVNTGEHDEALQFGMAASPVHRITVDGLIRLQEQRAALDRVIQKTNTYSANLAYNATAGAAGGLVLQGPVTVPSPPAYSHDNNAPNMPNATGTVSEDVCDADPNSPEFWRAQAAYAEWIRNAAELACHLFEPEPQPPFIPLNNSPPPLQVLPPLSIPTPQVPLVTTPPTMDPSSSNAFPLLNQIVPPCTPHPSASEPPLLQIQVPRPSNPIWRASTPPRFRDATTVTPPPWYRSVPTVQSTPFSNPSELPLPRTDIPLNPSLANRRAMLIPPRTLICNPTTRSVWDDKDLKEASSSEPSSSPTNSDDMTNEVYEYLSALTAAPGHLSRDCHLKQRSKRIARNHTSQRQSSPGDDIYGGDPDTELYGDGEQ